MSLLTGCSYKDLDNIRPDVNNEDAMILFADVYDPGYSLEAGEIFETPTGSTGGEYPSTEDDDVVIDDGGSDVIVSTSNVQPLQYTVATSSSYTTYLDEEVTKPLKEILNSLDPSVSGKLLVRVCHNGFDYVPGSDEAIQKSSSYKQYLSGTGVHNVAGTILPTFFLDWLDGNEYNTITRDGAAKSVSSTRKQDVLALIESSGVGTNATWYDAVLGSSLRSEILAMWGNPRLNCQGSLSSYIRAMSSSPIGTVPNIPLKYKTGGSTGNLMINPVGTYSSAGYIDRLATSSLGIMSTATPQSSIRAQTVHSLNASDKLTIAWAYVDGYSKTFVVIGCDVGQDLETLVGAEVYTKLQSIVSSTLSWNQYAEIGAKGYEVTTLAQGLKES